MPTLTLTEAQKLLTNLPPDVKIELRRKQTGDFELSNDNGNIPQTREDIIRKKYPDLMGQPITISKASKRYKVPDRTIRGWITADFIKIVDDGYPVKIDEADIAYCADTYRARKASGTLAGMPLFDENGLPYQIKHPDLSRRRKERSQ